jgi:hypothetical protein
LIPLLLYVLLATAVFSSTWIDPAGSWIGSPKDPQLFIWYLGWIPHQLSQGLNPLFTDHLNYPSGVNLMWNTSMLFPAVVLWPVTALLGPVVAYNVLITAGIALSAWLGYLAARRFVDSKRWSFLAGLIYGFSPALMAQSMGHPHVMVALFPPVALILGHEILVRRRMHWAIAGMLAGVAAALQLLTGEELLAVTLLVTAIGAALLARLPSYSLKAAGVALAVFIVLAAYPLGFQFLGPQRVSGSLQPPDVYVSDLLAFVVPDRFIHFTGNATENDAYIGLPLLVLFIAGFRKTRWLALTTVIVALLSLGPHLHINGTVTPIPLPWAAIAWLPLMGSALPARLMAIGVLGVAIVVAAYQPRSLLTGIVLVAGLLAIIPPIPYPSEAAAVPAFFRPGGDVERFTQGSVVLITPVSSHVSTDAMYWQTVANYRFKMPEGDAFTPGPYLGPHPSFMQEMLDALDAGQTITITPEVRAMFAADLQSRGVTTIVAGPSPGQAAIVDFLTQFEGSPPADDGGVKVWWLSTTP